MTASRAGEDRQPARLPPAAGATKDEIADVLLAIAPVAWIGRAVFAAALLATAPEDDIEAALRNRAITERPFAGYRHLGDAVRQSRLGR